MITMEISLLYNTHQTDRYGILTIFLCATLSDLVAIYCKFISRSSKTGCFVADCINCRDCLIHVVVADHVKYNIYAFQEAI